jgi:hypothetical protein
MQVVLVASHAPAAEVFRISDTDAGRRVSVCLFWCLIGFASWHRRLSVGVKYSIDSRKVHP